MTIDLLLWVHFGFFKSLLTGSLLTVFIYLFVSAFIGCWFIWRYKYSAIFYGFFVFFIPFLSLSFHLSIASIVLMRLFIVSVLSFMGVFLFCFCFCLFFVCLFVCFLNLCQEIFASLFIYFLELGRFCYWYVKWLLGVSACSTAVIKNLCSADIFLRLYIDIL